MSANWISRKLRRQRPGFSSDTYAHPSVSRYKPPISGPEPVRGEQLTGHSGQPVNRTTVTAKGHNGAKKTVITIRKVYNDAHFAGNADNATYKPVAATRPQGTPRSGSAGDRRASGAGGTSTLRGTNSLRNTGGSSVAPASITNVRYTGSTSTAAVKGTSNTIPTDLIDTTGTATTDSRSIIPTAVALRGVKSTGSNTASINTGITATNMQSTRPANLTAESIDMKSYDPADIGTVKIVNRRSDVGSTGIDPIAQAASINDTGELQARTTPMKRLLESRLSSNHPLTIQSEYSFESEVFMDAVESFGVEMPASPSTTVKDDCPQLKSPGSFTQSMESAESLATVIVDDGLSSWGLPKVIEHGYEYECGDSEMDPEDHSLRYYGIELEPQVAPPPSLNTPAWKLRTLLYVSSIVLAHKRQLHQRKQEQKEAALRAKLHFEREKRSRYFPFFASWI